MNKEYEKDDADALEKEIEKSVEKMIDEETIEAMAFFENDHKNYSATTSNEIYKTQAIPDVSKDILKEKDTSKNRRKTKKKQEFAKVLVLIFFVLAILVGFIAFFYIINVSKKNSFDYNYTIGMNMYSEKNYSEAIQYFSKAINTDEGKRNSDLRLKLAECYISTEEDFKAEKILTEGLNYDKYNEKLLVELAKYYVENNQGSNLTELIKKYTATEGEGILKGYMVKMPTSSIVSGVYNKRQTIELKTESGNKIYYTTDKSSVTARSKLYDAPIIVEKGKMVIKAVSVNASGVMSNELVLEIEVDATTPDAPNITPVTGTYEAGTKIEITNIPEGGAAYYTLDGMVPTKGSMEYTNPIDMPEGNTVFSAIIYDMYGQESAITKRNFNVGVSTKYSYDEAVERLKLAMITKKTMNKDMTVADGGQAKFTYYKKTTVANVEMYIIFFDIIKNGVSMRQQNYFGVDIATGKCYIVYEKDGALIASEY